VTRAQFIKGAALVLVGFAAGAAIGGWFATGTADREVERKARAARALWRVAERTLGHEEAIRLWREELAKPERPPSPEPLEDHGA
jgi:hypothetical protein